MRKLWGEQKEGSLGGGWVGEVSDGSLSYGSFYFYKDRFTVSSLG